MDVRYFLRSLYTNQGTAQRREYTRLLEKNRKRNEKFERN